MDNMAWSLEHYRIHGGQGETLMPPYTHGSVSRALYLPLSLSVVPSLSPTYRAYVLALSPTA